MRQEEHAQQKSFFQWTELFEKRYPALGRFWAVPNGGARHPAVAGKLKAEGVRRGIPDVFNLAPSATLELGVDVRNYLYETGSFAEHNEEYDRLCEGAAAPVYKGLILEFKSSTGSLSPEQRDWCAYFRSQGFRVEVPRSWVEAALITIDYFGLPDELKKNLPLHRIPAAGKATEAT